ncbi:hypothetical protein DPMN_138412 [Dreissena polymorpha]|uniref:Uncharacterized protein n=1 Tax=Dreissena polymorpha TaxID=45954 RepID=A0A9D4G7K0_DREPO|nr:hypothetical protein DPMN_138412 [Dreissena polymorpha]
MTVNLENEKSTVTGTVEMLTKKAGTENSITTEIVSVTATHNSITTENNEQGESPTKHDITQISLMIAGPFVLFDIGLIVLIYRKKLLSCLRGKHDRPMYNTNNNSEARNINTNNLTLSNDTSSLMEPVSVRGENGWYICMCNKLDLFYIKQTLYLTR